MIRELLEEREYGVLAVLAMIVAIFGIIPLFLAITKGAAVSAVYELVAIVVFTIICNEQYKKYND